MILRFLFFLFLAYVLYKLIVDFVIPIYKTTQKVKQGFRDMQQNMQDGQPGFSDGYSASPQETAKKERPPLGDYIDFEEVKE